MERLTKPLATGKTSDLASLTPVHAEIASPRFVTGKKNSGRGDGEVKKGCRMMRGIDGDG